MHKIISKSTLCIVVHKKATNKPKTKGLQYCNDFHQSNPPCHRLFCAAASALAERRPKSLSCACGELILYSFQEETDDDETYSCTEKRSELIPITGFVPPQFCTV